MAKNKSSGKAPKARSSRPRRGKSEAMTGAKENEVEVRIGHNSSLNLPEPIALSDDDFDLHYKATKSAKEKMNTAKRLYDGCCKNAKKVSADMLAAVKQAIAYDGADPEDIKKDLEIRGYVLKRRESPTQLVIHDMLDGDVQEHAYKRGFGDGEAGRPANNRYPEGSDLAAKYSDGWTRGQAKLVGVELLPKDDASADDSAEAGGAEDREAA